MFGLRDEKRNQSQKAFAFIGWAVGIGLTSNVVFAFQAATWNQFFAVGTVGLMYSAASLLLGCFIGFLFGIPRTFQQNPSKPTSSDPDKAASPGFDYRPNTNLEQISDWLTKILVGVGLTQVTSISARIEAISTYMVPGLGNFSNSHAFAMILLVFFSIAGFLLGYLWTRLYLIGAFRQADQDSQQKLSDVIGVMDTILPGITKPDDRQKVAEIKRKFELQLESFATENIDSKRQLEVLANNYDAVRRDMVSGRERTYKMSSIVAQIRAAALQFKPKPKQIQKLFDKGNDGSRIVALSLLQVLKYQDIFDIILESIGNSRTAFEQYTALSAAERMVTGLEAAERKKLKDVIEDQRSGGPGKWITTDSDRWGLSERILARL